MAISKKPWTTEENDAEKRLGLFFSLLTPAGNSAKHPLANDFLVSNMSYTTGNRTNDIEMGVHRGRNHTTSTQTCRFQREYN